MIHTVRILGIPMDLGQQRRGVDMGPSAVRYAGLFERLSALGHRVEDAGNILVPGRDEVAVRQHDSSAADNKLRHLPEVIAACTAIYNVAKTCAQIAEIPIFLGGDHAIAIGTVGGSATVDGLGLLWVDAHGDYNTAQTSPSGNIHGMPVAALTGHGHPDLVNLGHAGPKVPPQNIVMIGIRDLDSAERAALVKSDIRIFTMREDR